MIKVNGRDFEWQEGLTVRKLLEIKKYIYSRIIVTINGEQIPEERYEYTFIQDGDEVKAIHLLAGG